MLVMMLQARNIIFAVLLNWLMSYLNIYLLKFIRFEMKLQARNIVFVVLVH